MQRKFSLAAVFFFVSSIACAEQALTVKKLSEVALMTNDYLMQEYLGDVHYYSDQANVTAALKWYQISANQSAYAAAQASKILRFGEHGIVDCEQAIVYAKKNRQLSRGETDSIWLTNMMAWIYATCDDEKFRDGQRALELLRARFDESKPLTIPVYILDTFTASYAAAGSFAKALEYQKQVVESINQTGGDIAEFLSHLHSYEKKMVWVENTSILSKLELLEEPSSVDREINLLRKKRKIAESFYAKMDSEVTDIYVRLAKLYFDKGDYFLSANYVSRARMNGVSPEALKKAGIDALQ